MMQPRGVLVCPPVYFAVIDRKNPFMDPGIPVDHVRANAQWSATVEAFRTAGMTIRELAPLEGCEDMVFTANPAFTGLDKDGRRRAVSSRMRHASRRPEVMPQVQSLVEAGYNVTECPKDIGFEGSGDAIWHPGGDIIFLGIGSRTDAAAGPVLEETFDVPAVPVRLAAERFYHLDTALWPIDETLAVVYPAAFDADDLSAITARFPRVIEVDEREAARMACNGATAGNRNAIIHSEATRTIARLKDLGYDVAAVDTSEFIKSGGSVYCMKQYLY
ncbi:MAG: hypothetical protein JO078_09840 [Candidatus Eremiobacteraeota bacterium]|nr:hypothetical protein [Candidatus Eremiobacteraeota bacterium]MBV9700412.1 hypothetical protein [Candidatus Eremiobacteraeota bacterium]